MEPTTISKQTFGVYGVPTNYVLESGKILQLLSPACLSHLRFLNSADFGVYYKNQHKNKEVFDSLEKSEGVVYFQFIIPLKLSAFCTPEKMEMLKKGFLNTIAMVNTITPCSIIEETENEITIQYTPLKVYDKDLFLVSFLRHMSYGEDINVALQFFYEIAKYDIDAEEEVLPLLLDALVMCSELPRGVLCYGHSNYLSKIPTKEVRELFKKITKQKFLSSKHFFRMSFLSSGILVVSDEKNGKSSIKV